MYTIKSISLRIYKDTKDISKYKDIEMKKSTGIYQWSIALKNTPPFYFTLSITDFYKNQQVVACDRKTVSSDGYTFNYI